MKSVLIIGTGRLGHHLCMNMAHMGNEIMIVDKNEENMQDLLSYAMMAKVGDCTKEEVLKSLGVGNFDICFVCIGSDFHSSLEITSLLKEMGAKYVVSKANRDIQAKFLLRNGADDVVFAEKEMAERLAVKFSADNIFDYIQLTPEYAIYEIPTPRSWEGKTIRDKNVRAKYNLNILGVKRGGALTPLPDADHVFSVKERQFVVCRKLDNVKIP